MLKVYISIVDSNCKMHPVVNSSIARRVESGFLSLVASQFQSSNCSGRLDVRLHHVWELVNSNFIEIKNVATTDMLADCMIKPLYGPKFQDDRDRLNIRNLSPSGRERNQTDAKALTMKCIGINDRSSKVTSVHKYQHFTSQDRKRHSESNSIKSKMEHKWKFSTIHSRHKCPYFNNFVDFEGVEEYVDEDGHLIQGTGSVIINLQYESIRLSNVLYASAPTNVLSVSQLLQQGVTMGTGPEVMELYYELEPEVAVLLGHASARQGKYYLNNWNPDGSRRVLILIGNNQEPIIANDQEADNISDISNLTERLN